MLSALIYLRVTSLRNWLGSRIRRLRQPKYLAGAVVGIAYVYFFFFRGFAPPRPPAGVTVPAFPTPAETAAFEWLPAISALGSLTLLFVLALIWLVPTRPAALGFSEAEIAFLFPAPVRRRTLIHFRLISSQLRSLLGAAFMVLFSHRWQFLGGNALTHAAGWWFIFSGLNLHFSGANFTLTRLAARGFGAWRRRVLVALALAAVGLITFLRLPAAERVPAPIEQSLTPLAAWLVNLGETAPLSWLLWPLQTLLGPFLAPTTASFLLALGPALAVVVLHYLWVVRAAVSFEDAAVEHAEKRGARVAAWRAGRGRIGDTMTRGRAAPFPLLPTGRPEIAFLWKNLLSTWPYFRPGVWAGCALVIVAGGVWLRQHPAGQTVLPGIAAVVAAFGAYTLIVGPQFARQDLRSDLAQADILKTYPLAGWQIVLGQLLAPTAILTGILWLALLTIALALPSGRGGITPALTIAGALSLTALTPALAMLQLLVPNAAALVFPAWFQASRTRGGGIDVVGQRMIFFFAQLVTMLLALAPPTLLAVAIVFSLQWLTGTAFAILLAGFSILLVLAGEIALGLWWLGERFEKLDLSAELRA